MSAADAMREKLLRRPHTYEGGHGILRLPDPVPEVSRPEPEEIVAAMRAEQRRKGRIG